MELERARHALETAFTLARERRQPRLVHLIRPEGSASLDALWGALPAARRDRVRLDRAFPPTAYGLSTLLRRRFRLGRGFEPNTLLSRLQASLAGELPANEDSSEGAALEAFGFVLGAERADFRSRSLDRQGRWDLAHRELRRWLEGWAHSGGWLIGFEDVERGDRETAAFLQWAAQAGFTAPVVWVVCSEGGALAPGWAEALAAWRKVGALDELSLALPSDDDERWAALPEAARQVARLGALVDLRFSRELLAGAGPSDEVLTEGMAALVEGGAAEVPGEGEVALKSRRLRERALSEVAPEERVRALGVLEPRLWDLFARARAGFEGLGAALLPVLAEAAALRGSPHDASLCFELLGLIHRKHQLPAEAAAAFARAREGAVGVRRKVLHRRWLEEEHARGQGEAALALVDRASVHGASPLPSGRLGEAIAGLARDPADRWDQLGPAEAQFALDLARAEVLSQSARAEQARAQLLALEHRLDELRGDVSTHLSVNWARAFVWFTTEILGDLREAEALADRVRARLERRAFSREQDRLVFLRTQELVASRTGDYDLAQKLLREQLDLAQRLGDVREEAVAWNSKGIVHMAVGELYEALASYEKSESLSRGIGLRRREAIALHNRGLVEHELGQYPEADQSQLDYLALSREIGNRAALAYSPAARAAVALSEGQFPRFEALLSEARTVASENGWQFLIAWARALSGQAAVLQAAASERPEIAPERVEDLKAGLQLLAEKKLNWTEEFDPGEHSTFLAMATWIASGREAGAQVLRAAEERIPASCAVSLQWLAAGDALTAGDPIGPKLHWFSQRGSLRAVSYLQTLDVLRGHLRR